MRDQQLRVVVVERLLGVGDHPADLHEVVGVVDAAVLDVRSIHARQRAT